jgi:signal transduction histidine kinase
MCAGDEVQVTIADDGEGMDPDLQFHAFERFFRGDSARDRDRSGSGVGLTISRAIADLHGGSLTVASDGLGHGSMFTLTLPFSDAEYGSPPSGRVPGDQIDRPD